MLIKVIITTALLIIFGFYVFRIAVRTDYNNNNKLSKISSILEFLFFAAHANALYVYLPISWPNLPPLSENPIIFTISIIAIIIGLIIILFTIVPLGYKRAMGTESKALKTTGLYSYSRNPQLVGYGLVLIGFCLTFIGILSLIWFLIYLIVARWMVQSEEEYLSRIYNGEYKNYCASTPRYLIK